MSVAEVVVFVFLALQPIVVVFPSPVAGFSLFILRFLDHTRRATVGKTPLDE
jgi:hypothetical protein